jgi:hypothetical protein
VKKIKILLTFDYELPLGDANDYHRSLFTPADRLIDLATDLAVPIVLFTDICSAIRFKEWNLEGFYLPLRKQLKKALDNGHDLQLHIHPHWMSSNYSDDRFIPSGDFSLSDFKDGKNGLSIEGIIEQAFQELTAIAKEAKADYQCIAFRAGGYDVEPESKRILNKLYDLGVRIDSSVIKELYLNYNFSHIDYTGAPASSRWLISRHGPLIKELSSDLWELPITSKPTSLADIIRRRLRKIVNGTEFKRRLYLNGGKGFAAVQGKQDLKSKWKKIFNPTVLSLDKEHLEYRDLKSIVDYNVSLYESEPNDLIITLIGHPKSMGNYHLRLMKDFVQGMRKQFRDQVVFTCYRDLKLGQNA